MGASGAMIMSFFGSVFFAMTFWWQDRAVGWWPASGVVVFAVITGAALRVSRMPGHGVTPSKREERAILWSTIGEGVGLFLAANVVVNLHRPEWLLPSMAAVVGLHFLPIARAGGFTPFYLLGAALLLAGVAGFAIGTPTGGEIAGLAAASALWLASAFAIRRDWHARLVAMPEPAP